ncbi:cleavage stimulation factor subunit 2 [Trypanosoma conorhini]|uniref:Cleavage stimulation factor subunit 2 n=1 Tax=Trypanosoma conorhini TaxID=83891 RepID=A0A3R7P1D3_9TRYP|nr:cleavage stimulation factor subunit 2 [Trypanosoma conorhini]RNF27293.1 cleavage stimulation factor subunit 2 [Trypanosoma conorhini]
MVASHSTGVFFTGVPLFVEPQSLRKHFESVGHITDFRLLGPAPGRDFRYGFADYLDVTSAEEAIQRLNGTSFGERTMKVTSAANSRSRKRSRQHVHTHEPPVRGGMVFPRGYVDPLLGRDDNNVLECLQRMPVADAYEAVEQLRVLVLERKDEARKLLDSCPALRLAVVMILQHAGRLPYGPLPLEAVRRTDARPVNAAPTTAEEDTAEKKAEPTEEERDEVIEILTKLSEEDVERIVTMSEEDLDRIPDLVQRQQMSVLRARLLDMAGNLE